jgi:hypothetical protein
MQRMKSKVIETCLIAILPFLLVGLGNAQTATDSCYIGNVNSNGGHSFSIEINISNTDTLAGFQIPFSFSYGNIGITCDSVSYLGSRCQHFDCLYAKIDSTAKTVFLMGISGVNVDLDTPPLLPGSGKIATIYFSVSSVSQNVEVNIVKTRIRDQFRDFSFTFWDVRGESIQSSFATVPIKIR